MAKVKTEPIFIGEDNKVIELTGKELDEFNAMRENMQKADEERKVLLEKEKQLKISAYEKLGLTDEEIAAII